MKYSKRYIAFTIVLALVFILKFQILGVDNAQVGRSAEENWIHRYGIDGGKGSQRADHSCRNR